MTDHEINLAIAKSLNWTFFPESDSAYLGVIPEHWEDTDGDTHYMLHFCDDLNAMWQVEKTLRQDTQIYQAGGAGRYLQHLRGPHVDTSFGHTWPLTHRSAREKAVAYLKTMGLWKEIP